jgi:hypothetical protein
MSLEARVSSVEVTRIRDAQRIRALEKHVDTVSSPLWKRLLFILQGYRWRRVGRWYGKTTDLR